MIGFLLGHWWIISGLLGAGGGVLSMFFPAQALFAVRMLWAWLCHRSFWQLVSMGLAAFALIQHFQIAGERRHSAKVESARHADQLAYARAQTEAQAKNKAQVARVKQQQQEITDATVSHLSARLQLIAGELRRQGSAPQSASGSPAAGDPGATPCRAANPSWLCLSPQDRLSAAENEERHDELIDWVIAQSKVDPNKP